MTQPECINLDQPVTKQATTIIINVAEQQQNEQIFSTYDAVSLLEKKKITQAHNILYLLNRPECSAVQLLKIMKNWTQGI